MLPSQAPRSLYAGVLTVLQIMRSPIQTAPRLVLPPFLMDEICLLRRNEGPFVHQSFIGFDPLSNHTPVERTGLATADLDA